MLEMFIIINYIFNIIYIIRINIAKFIFILFDKTINSMISDKSINKFLDNICQHFKLWKNVSN